MSSYKSPVFRDFSPETITNNYNKYTIAETYTDNRPVFGDQPVIRERAGMQSLFTPYLHQGSVL